MLHSQIKGSPREPKRHKDMMHSWTQTALLMEITLETWIIKINSNKVLYLLIVHNHTVFDTYIILKILKMGLFSSIV